MERKNLKLIIIFFLALCLQTKGSSTQSKLTSADSLFKSRSYTQAFQIYEDILTNDQAYSKSMLLKMAYIQEGLENHDLAIYYLSLLYEVMPQEGIVFKIEELAQQKGFEGYQHSDEDFFYIFSHRYYDLVYYSLLVLTLLAFGTVMYRIFLLKKFSWSGFSAFSFVAIMFTIWNNIDFKSTKAIVTSPSTYLMTGPSSGADVIQKLSPGQRVSVGEQNDIWYSTKTNDTIGYLHQENIKIIELPKHSK